LDKQRVALTFDEWHRGQVVMRLGEKASEAGYGKQEGLKSSAVRFTPLSTK
jgi:hypothetical protein